MGRLINDVEKNIIEQNIFQYLENSYSQFNKRFQGTPIYVTYYNQSKLSSLQDQTLDNIQELLGKNSPTQFNKIEEFPLYLVNEVNPNMEIDESFGLTTNGNGEGIILPNTIKPFIGDYIYIEITTKRLLFRVTNLEIDKFNGQKFYKIEYNISPFELDEVEEQVEEEYITHYENIGTQDKAIVEKSSSILSDKINLLIEHLVNFYISNFMDKKFNVVVYQYNDKFLYDECLIKFINNYGLLEHPVKQIYSTYYIQQIFKESPAMLEMYQTTLFYALASSSLEHFKCENMVTIEIIKDLRDNPFSFDYREFYRTYYVTNGSHTAMLAELDEAYQKYYDKVEENMAYDDFDYGKQTSLYYAYKPEPEPKHKVRHVIIKPFDSKMIINANSNVEFPDKNEYFLENLIIRYFNKTLNIDESLINDINSMIFHATIKEFLLIPCLIFILKQKNNELLQ